MKQQSIATTETSSVTWENVDTGGRTQVQGFIQQVLEEEVTAFLGRQQSRGAAPSRRRVAIAMGMGTRGG
ncbi:MAG: hypothetical protein ABI945_10930 [Nitrospirales bacterium]